MSIIYDALKKADGNSAGIISKDNQPKKKKSNRNKVKLFILITFFLSIVFVAVFNFSSKKRGLPEPVVSELKQEKNQNTGLKTKVQKIEPKQTSPSYKLEGIVFDKNNPFAIINGKQVYEGDKIGDYIVSQINKESVGLSGKDAKESKILSISF
ncbi:MAG: hypothetical protein K9M00_05170 [Candidatus Omnitrophica bacterium]|nr:hypothetical protein [Candidatus Omnitrophota bacterium]MCF7888409.1 hypothetical protein [Candidatus Omnitrophota bacterium]